MKNILTLFVALLSFVAVSAQTQNHSIVIDEGSLVPVQTDIMSGVAIDKIGLDTSNRPCARIKMQIGRMSRAEIDGLSVQPVGGNVVVMKQVVASEGSGLIIELTAKQPTRFYLHSDKYGDSNEVSLNLEGNKEYRLSAQLNGTYPIFVNSDVADAEVYIDGDYKGRTNANYTLTATDVVPGMHTLMVKYGSAVAQREIEVTGDNLDFRLNVNTAQSRPQFVVFTVSPTSAMVVIDNKNYVPDDSGVVSLRLVNGSYNYEISADEYYGESGKFVVSGAKVEKIVTLKPAHGWLTMSLADADVYVDNKHFGKTPITKRKLASGEHSIMVVKELYHAHKSTITIEEGETLNYAPTLLADFATVTFDAGKGCDIYVNDERKGVSPWSGKLATGTYVVEARKEGYRSTSVVHSISASPATQSYKLDAPKPIMGSVVVTSTPAKADVLIDGKLVGQTPLLYDLLVGKHDVKVTLAGYQSYTKSVTIIENKEVELSAVLTKNASTATVVTNDAFGTTKHECVDLGLSVKWATCNVGASRPEEYGDYFAWGETTTKSSYTKNNSITYDEKINDIEGNSQYDAARANWGGEWRMPTKAEMQELKEKCIWMWTTVNGVKGCRVTGPNGNSIFLPAAGYCYGTSSIDVGLYGRYWSSTLGVDNDNSAYRLYFDIGFYGLYRNSLYYGHSIRPVIDK